jgi:sugar phosphate isomerase/epimerase
MMYASFNARAAGLTLTAAETIALAGRAGFGGVDLLVRDLLDSGDDPRVLRQQMDDLGLRGGAFPNPVDWRHDATAFARDLARLPWQAETAATLGLGRTASWVLPETPAAGQPGSDHASIVALHRERLGAIARTLDRFGIRVGLEVIGVASFRTGRGRPFVTRLADLDTVLGSLWSEAPNFGVVVDGWHLYAAGETVEVGLRWGVQQVVWVHVADLPAGASRDPAGMIDGDRGLPGEHGAIDSRRLLERLAGAGYTGPVTAEPMAGCRSIARLTPEAIADRLAAALRSVWPASTDASGRSEG